MSSRLSPNFAPWSFAQTQLAEVGFPRHQRLGSGSAASTPCRAHSGRASSPDATSIRRACRPTTLPPGVVLWSTCLNPAARDVARVEHAGVGDGRLRRIAAGEASARQRHHAAPPVPVVRILVAQRDRRVFDHQVFDADGGGVDIDALLLALRGRSRATASAPSSRRSARRSQTSLPPARPGSGSARSGRASRR